MGTGRCLGGPAVCAMCHVSFFIHTMIQVRIDLYKKSRVKLWISVENTHIWENTSPTLPVIKQEQSNQESLRFREGTEVCREQKMAFATVSHFIIGLGSALTLLCFHV